MGRILLIRHGQASVLSDNYDQLSPIGNRQGEVLGNYLQKEKTYPQNIFSGPLKRQIGTAKLSCQKDLVNGANLKVMDHLREHEGFQIVKSVIPKLIVEDEEVRMLASIDTEDKNDQIRSYLKIYEVLSTRWINGELEYDSSKYESWATFKSRVTAAMQKIFECVENGQTSLVFSSGGPISVCIGNILGLSNEKILHLSWVINNASISELIYNEEKVSLKSFNRIPHLQDEELITLV